MFFFVLSGLVYAEVEWQLENTFGDRIAMKDMAVSKNGKWVFLLSTDNEILIYDAKGQLKDKIAVDFSADGIDTGAAEEQLFVTSHKEGVVRALAVTFVQEIDITGAPVLGLKEAPVNIVVFIDYQCPYCARLMPTLEKVLENNSPHVKVAFKNFPLKMHKAALSAAAASLIADQEGKFWPFHSLMFEDFRNLSDDKIVEIAVELGFDATDFRKKMKDVEVLKRIHKDIEDGRKAGVQGIPKIFINGRPLQNRSMEGFQAIIDSEIKKLGAKDTEK